MMSERSTLPANIYIAAEAFQFNGTLVSIKSHGNGRIHRTFRVVSQEGEVRRHWILQRLNQTVLPDLDAVTHNIVAVTHHLNQLRKSALRHQPLLTPVSMKDGRYLHQTQEGHVWRAFVWIDGVAYQKADRLEIAHEAASAVGRFHADLADYNGPPLATTIADFHHTANRLERLENVVGDDPRGRAEKVAQELSLIDANCHLAEVIPLKKISQRIVHNDPKLNNILFDSQSDQAICLIDFDTVMPGTALHDFGDMVRSMTNGADEGALPEDVFFDDKIYGAIEKGYLSVMGDTLTSVEKELLPLSGQVLAFELGVRFLTDYLSGDVYFPTTQNDDNLNRCKVQLALLNSMQKMTPLK